MDSRNSFKLCIGGPLDSLRIEKENPQLIKEELGGKNFV